MLFQTYHSAYFFVFWQESTTDYVNSIQDAINEAKAKAEDFNSREKVGGVHLERVSPCYN